MYITLNSAGELSDSNFVNSFSEALVIKPNSYICLTGAGFQSRDTSYNLGYIDTFSFIIQYTYNATSTPFSFPAGNYTLDAFCQQFNALTRAFSGQFAIILNAEDTEADGVHIAVNLFRLTPPANTKYFWNVNYLKYK